MALPKLPELSPRVTRTPLHTQDFGGFGSGLAPIGGGSSGGLGFPPINPIQIGYNGAVGAIGTALGGIVPGGNAGASIAGSFLSSLFGSSGFGCQLARIAFFILGLIAIIGAIYLYKPSVITTPVTRITEAASAASA